MSGRHAKADSPAGTPLRLVETDPRAVEFPPEVRAILDAVAALHTAVISWAATTAEPPDRLPPADPPTGRHRR